MVIVLPMGIGANFGDQVDVHNEQIASWTAIHHTHNEEGELDGPPPQPISDGEVEKAVDDIMKEIDLNGDGLIDYSEYLNKVQD
uniref:EF-hand domain-containing protein n=1 Tax=Globodera pallida TaxID=36090 RepID=A0A183BTK0_GLOPA